MTISEAVKQAKATGKKICRPIADGDWLMVITPTDTPSCCYFEMKRKNKPPQRNWNPKAEDLVADDWELYDEASALME